MLKITIEEFGNNSLSFLEKKIYQHLEKEEDYVLILPNRKIIQKIRERALDKFGVIGDLRLYTFEDLIDRSNRQSEIGMYFVDIILRRSIEKLQNQKEIEKESLYLSKGFLIICKQILSLLRNSNADIKSLESLIELDSLKTILKILAEYELQMEIYNIPDPYGAPVLDKSICESYKGSRIYITGFQEFRPVELEWIKEASCNPVEITLQGSRDFAIVRETVEKLRKIGFKEENKDFDLFEKEKNLLSGKEETHIKLLQAEDPYLEAKGICQEIKRQKLQGVSFQKMIIGIKRADQEDLLLYHLEKENIPYHYAKNISLIKLPFFKELKTLISEYENLQAFLYANAGNSLIEDLRNKTALQLKSIILRKNYSSLKEYESDQEIAIEEDQEKIESFFSGVKKWMEIFETNNKEAFFEELILLLQNKIKEEENPFDREPYKDFLLWSQQLSGQYGEIIDSLNHREFCDFLTEAFEIFTYQEKKSLYGVEIRNIREIKLSDCDILFLPGCNDKNYPRKKEYHYFYNEKTVEVLKECGVSLHNTSEDLEEDRLDFLSAVFSAKKCLFFSYGAEELPSFYLRNLNPEQEIIHYSVKDFIKPDFEHISTESDLKKHNGIYEKKTIESPAEKSFYLKSAYSVTELETYNSCPAQYYYRYGLELQSPYEDPKKYETLLLGIVCHEMLELFYKNFAREIMDYLNRDLFDWAEKREFVEENIFSIAELHGFNIRLQEVKLELSLYAGHILRLIRKDLESLKQEPKLFLPARFEESITVEHFYKGERDRRISLRGRVDRIDQSTDGEMIFIDYKLGSGSVKTWGDYEKGDTLQFPIYSLASDPRSCKYLSVKKEEITPFYTVTEEGRKKGEITLDELKEMQKNIRIKIDEILEGIGNHDFNRGPAKEGVCIFCDYKMICRIRREVD